VRGKKETKLLKRLIFLLILFIIVEGCGIYTIYSTLNSPYDLTILSTEISFKGSNTESYFAGYDIWYKESDDTQYRLCRYNKIVQRPTIDEPVGFQDTIHIEIKDLFPQDSDVSFYNSNTCYYFAVSSYGAHGEESPLQEFPEWCHN